MKKVILLCVVSASVGAFLSAWLANLPDPSVESVAQEPYRDPPPSRPGQPSTAGGVARAAAASLAPADDEDLTPEERVNIAVYETANRSVVNIDTRSVRTEWIFEVPTTGAGSGVVLDKQGHILTNLHVVKDARAIRVTLFDGKSYDATPIGADNRNDLAILKVDASGDCLFPIVLGDSSRLRVGQRALAIGNPFGLERTLSVGVISSINRPFSQRRGAFRQLIQLDVDINPGNSGGPLLDNRARMIGMNTMIASETGQSAGIGFAIPINAIARVLPELIEHGRVVRAHIGIASVYPMEEGLLITELVQEGAAEQAGLKGPRLVVRESRQSPFGVSRYVYVDRSAADIIVAVDGRPVRTRDELLDIVESKKPGDRVTVEVLRKGRRVDVPVVLDSGE